MVIPFKYTGKVVFAIVISLLGCFSSQSFSQEIQDSILPVRLDKSYVKSYWTDGKRIITAPFHWGVRLDYYRFSDRCHCFIIYSG